MNIVLRILAGIANLLYHLLYPVFWLQSTGGVKSVSKVTDDLLKISATDLAEKIRNKQISSEAVCQAYINRIKEVNPIINAVVEERFDSALKDARNVDVYLQTSALNVEELRKIKPLLGVPLTVKESCSLAGYSHAVGTLGRKGVKAHVDGDAVSKLRASGAIPLLVSNTPELCLGWECTNFITGTTNNPYDTSRSSSGSSGGEGALLGAGASLIGVGSDIAGSIRLPALSNGVFGHKPTPRTISVKGHYPYSPHHLDYLVIGPITRYAKDLPLMTKIMCNGRAALLNLDEKVDLKEVKVFYLEEMGKTFLMPSVDEDVKRSIRRAVHFLKIHCGCQVQDNDIQCDLLDDSPEITGSILYNLQEIPNLLKGENHSSLPVEILKSALRMSQITMHLLDFYIVQFVFNTFVMKKDYYAQNDQLKQHLIVSIILIYCKRDLWKSTLGHNGVLICPTFPTSAMRHNTSLLFTAGLRYLTLANTLGLPATHVPCGLGREGSPTGFQVMAAPHQDRLCFAVAKEMERCFGGWISPGS